MTAATRHPPTGSAAGELLREWRLRRRLSQLDLAIEAGVSARHGSSPARVATSSRQHHSAPKLTAPNRRWQRGGRHKFQVVARSGWAA